jgi:hypothetical protein
MPDMSPLFRFICCLTICTTLACDEVIDQEFIIVADAPPDPGSIEERSPPSAVITQRGQIYSAVWHHPEQTFVDSEIGPLPLWSETVYDGSGNPKPRFPDVFSKRFLDNPNEETALAYLEAQRVKARRYLQASQIMQQTAIDFGLVTPETFRPPQAELTNNRALTPPYQLSAENWGVPVLDPQQARSAGILPADIPETPGRTTTRYVEILYFWDHRCPFSMRGFRDLAAFGTDLFKKELGPRVITISLDNDPVSTKTQLDFLQWNGVETHYIENWLDQTELQGKMQIRVTPTYVFIDRRSGKILRYEGLKDLGFLRTALLTLVGHQEQDWDRVRPEWFRPVQAAAGTANGLKRNAGEQLPEQSTPVQAPTRRLKAWDPDGQSDR